MIKIRLTRTSAICLISLAMSATFAESKVQTISYGKSSTALDSSKARSMIQAYYNRHGSWAGIYSMKKITGIRLKHLSQNRVVAHVEYKYQATNGSIKHRSGVDKRTFVLIRNRTWNVIGMGRHMSGSL